MNKRTVLSLAVGAVLIASPAAKAQDLEAKIESLQKQLEAAKASIREGQQTVVLIEGELTELRHQVTEQSRPDGSGDLKDASSVSSASPSSIASVSAHADAGSTKDTDALATFQRGMQGSPQPLRESRNYLTGQDLLDESFPNSWPIPGTGVRMAINGYAKLDFIQDLDYVGDRYEFYLPSIAVEGTPEASLDGQTTLHAKESRIGFDFRKTVTRPNGSSYPLQAFLEIDFFDDRETFALQPRLRHAYGVVGRLLAGQTWSTSADLAALAGMVDFSGGDAVYGDRLAQVRWADRLNETTTWAVALQENKADVGNPLGFDGQNRNDTPTLSGYLRWNQGKAHLGLGYDVFGVKWQGGESGPDASDVGWGVSLTGRYLIGKKSRNALSGQVTYGKGSAYQVVSLRGAGAGAVLNPQGDIDTLRHWQVYGAYSHYWTDALNSSLVLAHAEVDTVDYQPGSQIKSVSSAHLNLIWFPYKSVSTGIELMWGERENRDGATGDAVRLQGMLKYKFN